MNFMKIKNTFFKNKETSLKDIKEKSNDQITEGYRKKRKRTLKKNLSKFCQ